MNSIQWIGTSGLLQSSDNQEILYELKPDLNTYFKKVRFSTNGQGLRDKNYERQKASNAFRVAVLGDSFTLPAGVAIEEAYHSVLEKNLAREYPDKQIEFINFAVGGYNLRQYAATLEHKAILYDPDLVLIGFCAENDWFEPPGYRKARLAGKLYQVKPESHPFFDLSFLTLIKGIFRKIGKADHHNSSELNLGPNDDLNQEARDYMDAMFGRIYAVAESEGAKVMVVALGIRPLKSKHSNFLRNLATKHQALFLDTTQAFRNTNPAEFFIYRADHHPNGKANQIFAKQIHAFFRNLSSQGKINL